MELVKVVEGKHIFKKSNGRYAVKNKAKKWVNGQEKVDLLLKENLIKVSKAAPKEQEPVAEDTPAEEASES